ncbi:uncharacterized protein PHACADRAFT_212745 [Phanerochaete carnosa HHB-10118-sp]|uniref:DUF6533 domain-containing protein n=1 Tax=Phanerochaete carnosa (strain HHB-10118-sp) TaxID=650164 RepID=K5VZA7_PHACS|nr:uncharacterized protein PHACADRAFT_212745 [Phanerochaete carnosa HHB-10118-sp]EKM52175.1 hypothetical protein PHACADRAFT_212745 [Phanerochaete carnosa HHB-10118-sp]
MAHIPEPQQELPTEVVQTIYHANLLLITVAALPLYEYTITFRQEVEIVWKRQPTLASGLLLITRWSLVIGSIMLTLPQPTPEGIIFATYVYQH